MVTTFIGKAYDALLEPMLHRWKSRVARWIADESPGLTLDICCGTGKQCRLIADKNPVIGIDLSLDFMKYAKSVAPNIPFICADAERLPFKNGTFQNANISLALHDKPEALRQNIVAQAQRILRNNGHLFIIDFEKAESMKSKIGYIMIYLIELLAGHEHFSNGRQFVLSGGLKSFLQRHNITTQKIYTSTWGCSSITMNRHNF